MKTFNKILKVLATIATIIGIVYVVATYGDKIVAWANNLLDRFFDNRTRFFDIDEQMEDDDVIEDVAEDVAPEADVAGEA